MIRNFKISSQQAARGKFISAALGLTLVPLAWASKPHRIEWVDATDAQNPTTQQVARPSISGGPTVLPIHRSADVLVREEQNHSGGEFEPLSAALPDPLSLPAVTQPDRGNVAVAFPLSEWAGLVAAGADAGNEEAESAAEIPPPRLIKSAKPNWPYGPKFRGFSTARVVVEFLVDEEGAVREPSVVDSTDARVNKLALRAISAYQFASRAEDGRPAGMVRMQQPVIFGTDPVSYFREHGVRPVGPARPRIGMPEYVEARAGIR